MENITNYDKQINKHLQNNLQNNTANIATNTLTVNSLSELYPSYHVLNQEINGKTDY